MVVVLTSRYVYTVRRKLQTQSMTLVRSRTVLKASADVRRPSSANDYHPVSASHQ